MLRAEAGCNRLVLSLGGSLARYAGSLAGNILLARASTRSRYALSTWGSILRDRQLDLRSKHNYCKCVVATAMHSSYLLLGRLSRSAACS